MQTELLNRRKWRTRIELSTAIFEYWEILHNRQRRHSAIGLRTPIEYETLHHNNQSVAWVKIPDTTKLGHIRVRATAGSVQ